MRMAVVAPDGTLVTREQHIPQVAIARTDDAASLAIETRQETIAQYPPSDVLYAERVTLGFARTRAVRR